MGRSTVDRTGGEAVNYIFDLGDPDVIADPYPSYALLRDQAPVHHSTDPDLWISAATTTFGP